jgi:hypothetical protein
MSRDEGLALVAAYQNVLPPDKAQFLRWAEIDEREFDACIDRFRDPAIWRKGAAGNWMLTDSVLNHADAPGIAAAVLERREAACKFRVTGSKAPNADETRPVLMARGHVDGHPVPRMANDVVDAPSPP